MVDLFLDSSPDCAGGKHYRYIITNSQLSGVGDGAAVVYCYRVAPPQYVFGVNGLCTLFNHFKAVTLTFHGSRYKPRNALRGLVYAVLFF